MKKTIISAFCFVAILACRKEDPKPEPEPAPADNVAPVITLNGKQKDTVLVFSSYVDAGATASDDRDGNITSRIVMTGGVDTSTPINYTLTYNVSDQAGNHAQPVVRMVNVKTPIFISPGKYMVACTSNTYNPGVDPDLSASSSYTCYYQLNGQSGTQANITALNIGPITGPTNIFGINGSTFSFPTSPVNATTLTFAYGTGTVSPSKTTFTIDTKYYETMYPNKFYEVRNVFTKQ